jgi:hypothetical protein
VTLEDLGNIGEFLGAIGVIASLVYLAIQIRQNTRSIRSATYQSSTRDIVQLSDQMSQDPELTRIWFEGLRGFDSMSQDDRRRFAAYMMGAYRRYESMLYQTQQGLLEQEWWEGVGNNLEDMTLQPGTQAWWTEASHLFRPEFQQFVDGIIEKNRAAF